MARHILTCSSSLHLTVIHAGFKGHGCMLYEACRPLAKNFVSAMPKHELA